MSGVASVAVISGIRGQGGGGVTTTGGLLGTVAVATIWSRAVTRLSQPGFHESICLLETATIRACSSCPDQ